MSTIKFFETSRLNAKMPWVIDRLSSDHINRFANTERRIDIYSHTSIARGPNARVISRRVLIGVSEKRNYPLNEESYSFVQSVRTWSFNNNEPDDKIPDLLAALPPERLVFVTYKGESLQDDSSYSPLVRGALSRVETDLLDSLSHHVAALLTCPGADTSEGKPNQSAVDRIMSACTSLTPFVLMRKRFVKKVLARLVSQSLMDALRSYIKYGLFHDGVFSFRGVGTLICSANSVRFLPSEEIWNAIEASQMAGVSRDLAKELLKDEEPQFLPLPPERVSGILELKITK